MLLCIFNSNSVLLFFFHGLQRYLTKDDPHRFRSHLMLYAF